MFGWRARIGYISPGISLYSQEWDRPLPEGVVWAIMNLGVDKLTPEEFEQAADKWISAGKALATRDVDIIIIGGTPPQVTLGHEKCKEAARQIQEITGIKTVIMIDGLISALKKLSAKKIVMATPYQEETNEKHKRFLEEQGFNVLHMKGLGLGSNCEITKQPPYASYRLAREAFREAPQADAVWIGCPAWPVLSNVATLENDIGKPVISDLTYLLFQALTELGIKGPIKGYGKLLETL